MHRGTEIEVKILSHKTCRSEYKAFYVQTMFNITLMPDHKCRKAQHYNVNIYIKQSGQ